MIELEKTMGRGKRTVGYRILTRSQSSPSTPALKFKSKEWICKFSGKRQAVNGCPYKRKRKKKRMLWYTFAGWDFRSSGEFWGLSLLIKVFWDEVTSWPEFSSCLISPLVGLGADSGSLGVSSWMNSLYAKFRSMEVTSIRASRAALISPTICRHMSFLCADNSDSTHVIINKILSFHKSKTTCSISSHLEAPAGSFSIGKIWMFALLIFLISNDNPSRLPKYPASSDCTSNLVVIMFSFSGTRSTIRVWICSKASWAGNSSLSGP